jgi:hypothetical protein
MCPLFAYRLEHAVRNDQARIEIRRRDDRPRDAVREIIVGTGCVVDAVAATPEEVPPEGSAKAT